MTGKTKQMDGVSHFNNRSDGRSQQPHHDRTEGWADGRSQQCWYGVSLSCENGEARTITEEPHTELTWTRVGSDRKRKRCWNGFDYLVEREKAERVNAVSLCEWELPEITVDTGASDSAMPRTVRQQVSTLASVGSQNGGGYIVATGETLYPLKKKRKLGGCTSNGRIKHITMQVADVHKPCLG